MDADNTVLVWDLVPGFHIGILATLSITESHARKFDYCYIKVRGQLSALIFRKEPQDCAPLSPARNVPDIPTSTPIHAEPSNTLALSC